MLSGTNQFPAVGQAAQAAEKYLNLHGGVGGKKVNLVVCDMQNTDQAAQECGQQFGNDANMPFAIMGLTLNGGPFYAAMNAAHKPILGGLGITPADNSPADTFFYYPGATYYYGIAQTVKDKGWKSVAYIDESEAASTAGEQTVASQLAGSGVALKATTIATSASDVTPQVQAAGIASADATLIFTTGTCPQVASAMQSLSIKPKQVLAVNTCLTPANIAANPSLYAGWILVSPLKESIVGKGVDPDIDTFLNGWQQYGSGGTPGTFAELGWGLVLTAARVFQGASTITPASALTALQSYKGAVVMGPKSVSCPGPSPTTATCGQGLTYYQITDGKLVPSTS
jgi:ABC-type branched-subunit amino acid transport system substrate-binding protein